VLAMESYYNRESTDIMLEDFNLYFTYMFTIEMVIKICGLGLRNYARDGFNLFDGILVMISILDVVIDKLMGISSGASVIAVFRTMRLLRVFKLATKSKSLLILLSAIMKTMKDISFFSLLLFIFLFIVSLLGREFFSYKVKQCLPHG
jgi:hypothetical protein